VDLRRAAAFSILPILACLVLGGWQQGILAPILSQPTASSNPISVRNVAGSSGTTATTYVVTLPATLASSTIACGFIYDAADTVSSITDNNANTYTQAQTETVNGGNSIMRFYNKFSAGSGVTTITATFNANSHGGMGCGEVVGLPTGALDKVALSTTFTQSWTSLSTTATAQANELLFGMSLCPTVANCTFTPGSGWSTVGNEQNAGNGLNVYQEYEIVSATGTYAATGTVAGGDTANGDIETLK
jgi:hypothetical protein